MNPLSTIAATLLLLLGLTTAVHAADPVPARPNVVVFLTDDESWLERSAYGWSNIPTPNFDRVARDGILFKHGYTSAPSCAPSRAALLTGRNFWELEQGAFIQAWLPKKFPVLPDLMEAAGYAAGFTGKGYGPALTKDRDRNPAGQVYNGIKRKVREEGFSPVDYAANFARFLDGRKDRQPFYFNVWTTEPHDPCADDNHIKLKQQFGVGLEDIKVPAFLPDTPGVRRDRANMLYEVCRLDQDLGLIIKALEDRGELANTLLIVTSDNGTAVPRSKASSYDWGLHMPMAVMWPAKIKPGRTVDDFVGFADIAPTVLEAAGVDIPPAMSGRSFLNVLLSDKSGQVDPARTWIAGGLEWHGELPPVNFASRMIRDGQFQYIVNYSDAPRIVLPPEAALPDEQFDKTAATAGVTTLLQKHPNHPRIKPFVPLLAGPRPPEELYDCQADPFELNNLANDPKYADAKAKLKARLEAYQKQTGDPRVTGDMKVFDETRQFVQDRKRKGYKDE